MELGIDSFAVTLPDPETGRSLPAAERMARLLAEVEVADRAGLDVFGIGEHHRAEFLDAAPAVILAAAAARTSRIRLTSAVTVLSAADPVRVFQEFATLDLIAKGRAEIVVGRGSFGEAYPLFGFAAEDYDALFAEKLDLLLTLRGADPCHLARPVPPAAHRPRRLSASAPGDASDLDRCGWNTGLLRARRHPRPAADGRHHRR